MATNFLHTQLIAILTKQGNQMDRLYARKSREIAQALKGYTLKDPKNPWKGNRAIEKRIDAILKGIAPEISSMILSNAKDAVGLSNKGYDALVDKYVGKTKLPEQLNDIYYARNAEALAGFSASRLAGLHLSDRVWKQAKDQIEFFIRGGLADGTDAGKIARQVQQFLKEPARRFRRVRDAEGVLRLSSAAKAYHPGQGVYRSSYQNALRLARNEINIAYRQSDHMRRQELDFILGFRVNLSNAHPRYDICDEMVGVYPKDFRFVQWHVNCLCFTTTVLLSKEDFVKSINSDKFDQRRQIRSIPSSAKKYIEQNSERIAGWKSKPYFIDDNFKLVDGSYVYGK